MQHTEKSILASIKMKDKKGLESLFRQFYRPLVMYACQYLERIDEAEDLVQEVFVKLWERDSLQQVDAKLYSYLYTTVRNACLNKLVVLKKIQQQELDEQIDLVEEHPLDEEAWAAYIQKVHAEIEKLPERTQQIFKAIVLERRKYKDVAVEMEISTNTIKTSLSRALTKLRTTFKDDDMAMFMLLCICTRILK
ncbi:RNA polymerase sigma-70 factor (ECF subfamily) [Sphingobacterium yanglingense]|uniref:RNA polymerase sigma-70 factor (ECF subfamily) n=2 Tax=Sphingobacterium yanglingense TaxID=1437280 RepID=A0A4R6WKG0_9SPHI|nr:RNA polymerase sigma-70 factor (ECF subfamily) [Sphingobacterium yanglingense]